MKGALLFASDHAAQAVVRFGIKTVFAVAGESHTRLLRSFEEAGVRIIGTRTETGAIGAADGYARVTGLPGVALVVAEQGVPAGLPALLTAQKAGSPVVVLAARRPHSSTQGVHGAFTDQSVRTSIEVAKNVRTVASSGELGNEIELALNQATDSHPGPVIVNIPTDLYGHDVEPFLALPTGPATVPFPDPDAVAIVVGLIRDAARPVLIVGEQLIRSSANNEVRAISHAFNIPVLGDGFSRGVVEEDHLLGAPMRFGLEAIYSSDLVVYLGIDLDLKSGFSAQRSSYPNAKIVQVSASPAITRRPGNVDHVISADSGAFSRMLLAGLRTSQVDVKDNSWFSDALRLKTDSMGNNRDSSESGELANGLHPSTIVATLSEEAPGDAIFVIDGAKIFGWCNALLRVRHTASWIDHQPLGSMGSSFPLALGAAAAESQWDGAGNNSERKVIFVTGDGAFGYYFSEIASFIQSGLSIVVLVANDSGWGAERTEQTMKFGYTQNAELSDVDFAKVATGLGAIGLTARTQTELRGALKAALADSTTSVIDVRMLKTAAPASISKSSSSNRHGELR